MNEVLDISTRALALAGALLLSGCMSSPGTESAETGNGLHAPTEDLIGQEWDNMGPEERRVLCEWVADAGVEEVAYDITPDDMHETTTEEILTGYCG